MKNWWKNKWISGIFLVLILISLIFGRIWLHESAHQTAAAKYNISCPISINWNPLDDGIGSCGNITTLAEVKALSLSQQQDILLAGVRSDSMLLFGVIITFFVTWVGTMGYYWLNHKKIPMRVFDFFMGLAIVVLFFAAVTADSLSGNLSMNAPSDMWRLMN